MIVLSSFSCLTVISSAAVVDSDGEVDENGIPTTIYWELDDLGVLTIFTDCNPTWLTHRYEIKKVIFKEGVTAIPASAFIGCENLVEVDTSEANSLAAIENSAFVGTAIKSFYIDGISSIGAGAFQNCDDLQIVNIGYVGSMDEYAFYDCDKLSTVLIGGGLHNVEKNVFKSCDSLSYVWFGNGIIEIGYGMFEDCVALATVELPDSLEVIGAYAFENCISFEGIKIPDSVNTIGEYAFNGSGIVELVISKPIEEIGAYAFQNCDKLESVDIFYVDTIAEYGFYDCDNLVSVAIGGGLLNKKDQTKNINEETYKNIFKSCDSLSSVRFGNGTIYISYGMFDDCVSLETVELPDSLQFIGGLAFENCRSLKHIVIPDSVTSVGAYAFYDCVSAESLYVGHSVESFGEFVFGNNKSLVSTEFKCKMPVISKGMFYGCELLDAMDNLPQGVKTIGDVAFMRCANLSSFTIPNTVETIGTSAFDGTSITNIDIPWNVTSIGEGAFTNCELLEKITVDAKNPSYASVDGALYDITLETLLCCPAGKTGTYTIKDGTVTIDNGAFIGCDSLALIEVPATVTSVANNAFNGCADSLVIKANCDSYIVGYAQMHMIETKLVHSSETQWVEIKAPTCTEDGEKANVCSACEFKHSTESIEALGHFYDSGVVTKKATCEEAGVVTFTCTRCGDFYTVEIPATEHNYDNGTEIVKATCETEGTKRFRCQNEGCYDYYDITLPALNHIYNTGVVTKAATCTDEGVMTYTCTRTDCGASYTEAIPATGHAYDDGVIKTAPTCDAEGEKVITCANCGDSYSEPVPALGHNYVEELVKDATCVEDGKVKFTCENCGDAYTESVKGEHKYTENTVKVDATCEKEGHEGRYCVICRQFADDATVIPAKGHSYENGKCTDCGKSDGSVKPGTPKISKITNTRKGTYIKWNAIKNADCYNIYARANGKTKLIATVDASEGTTYVDSSAKSGTTYTYFVAAVNGTIEGAYNKTGATITFVAEPDLKSATATQTGVKVTWGKVTGAESYRIIRRTASSSWKTVATVTGVGKTSYIDKTAKSGTAYIYAVRACNGDDVSSFSGTGVNILFLATPDVKSVKRTTSGVTVTWGKVTGATSYRVYRKTETGKWVTLGTVSGSATSFKDTTAKSGTTYIYTVRAIKGSVKSSYESGLKIKYIAAPKLVSATVSKGKVTVKWEKVTGAQKYNVYRKTANGSWAKIATTSKTTFVDKTAKKGVTYKYTVRAVSGSVLSAYNTKGLSAKVK